MCKRTMYKRARIPMFLWERRACANSGAQAVFPRPRKNGLGTRRIVIVPEVVTCSCMQNGVGLNGNRRDGPGSCFLKVRHYHTIQKTHHTRK